MYEDLVKRLRDISNSDSNIQGNYIGFVMLKAANVIEELQSHYCPHMIRNVHDRGDDSLCRVYGCEVKELPRWIPVTERLPEKDGLYLVCNQPYMAQWVTVQQYRKDSGWHGSSVTHWMPLPEPPKGDGE